MRERKIVATVVVKDACKHEMMEIFKEVVDETRKEVDCIAYDLHQSVDNPLKYMVVERWQSQEAIDVHYDTPHFKAFVEAVEGKIDSLTVEVLKKIY